MNYASEIIGFIKTFFNKSFTKNYTSV